MGEMRACCLTDSRDDIADDTVAIGRRTAIGIAAPVVIGTEELIEQVRMAAVDFDGIEAAVADALGRLAYSPMRCWISAGLMATPTVPVFRSGTADGER